MDLRGRSPNDVFAELSEALNDYPGTSPLPEDIVLRDQLATTEDDHHNSEATSDITIQQTASVNQGTGTFDSQMMTDYNSLIGDPWGYVWPLWGDSLDDLNGISLDPGQGM